jgi:hypothetical protein
MATIIVKTLHPKLNCRCGSDLWNFRTLSSWDKGPIEESTLIHVACRICGRNHGLLGENQKDWELLKEN